MKSLHLSELHELARAIPKYREFAAVVVKKLTGISTTVDTTEYTKGLFLCNANECQKCNKTKIKKGNINPCAHIPAGKGYQERPA